MLPSYRKGVERREQMLNAQETDIDQALEGSSVGVSSTTTTPSHDVSFLEAAQSKMRSITTLQSGLGDVFATMKKVKPFVLARLVRTLMDAQNFEQFTYSVVCFFDLYSEYLPDIKNVSMQAILLCYNFFAEWRQAEQATPANNSGVPNMEPQAFVRDPTLGDSVISKAFEKVCGYMGFQTNAFKDKFGNFEAPLSILAGLVGITGLFFGDKIFSFVIDSKKLQSNLGRIAKEIKDYKVVSGEFGSVWETIMNFVGGLFGYKYLSPTDEESQTVLREITDLRDAFTELQRQLVGDLTSIVQSERGLDDLSERVKQLEVRIEKLLAKGRKTCDYTIYVRQFIDYINATRRVINEAKSSICGKMEPVVVYIHGEPGVGKSELTQKLISDLSDKLGRKLTCYTRNAAADPFWSKYCHQDVVIYDDFGQDKLNQDHSELIGIYTPNQYALNMAECERKGTVFTSQFVFLCSNISYCRDSKRVNVPSAVDRRRDLFYHIGSRAVHEYKERHGKVPSSDWAGFLPDWTHLQIQEWKPIHQPEVTGADPDRAKIIRGGIRVHEMSDEILDVYHRKRTVYDKKLAEMMQAEVEHLPIEQILAQHGIDLPDPPAIPPPPTAPQMEAQTLQEVVKGRNLILLQGPSGCGKSHLLSEMDCTVIRSTTDVLNPDGTLKNPDMNYHFEDCSITPDATNRAIDVCQLLSDRRDYNGNCIFTANTDMLIKNLEKRGAEAVEVFYRRCRVFTVKKKAKSMLMRYTAKDISPTLGWDNIYYVVHGGKEHNLVETQIAIECRERTVSLIAKFDDKTLIDFYNRYEKLKINLAWEQFSTIEDFRDVYNYIDGFPLETLLQVRQLLPLFKAIPSKAVSPRDLVRIVNAKNIRIPATTPSLWLEFDDFDFFCINHQTYVQLQIRTPTFKFPDFDLEFVPMGPPSEDSDRKQFFLQLTKFIGLIAGGTMIVRELFGLSKPSKPCSCKTKKVDDDDTESTVSDSDSACLNQLTEPLDTEASKAVKRAKKRVKLAAQTPKIAKSQQPKEDKDYDGMPSRVRQGTFDNEARKTPRGVTGYSQETKILTHTDIAPRFESPSCDSCLEITLASAYHPSHFRHIYKLKNDIPEAFRQFQDYLACKNLDPDILQQAVEFQGLTLEEEKWWRDFFIAYRVRNLTPESIADNQAAALIPLLTANQVFVVNDGEFSQRALMVCGRIGITTAHGFSSYSSIQCPFSQQIYPCKALETNTEKDYVIFEAAKQCQSFKDIRHFIRSSKDTEPLEGCDCFMLTVARQNKQVVTQIRASKVQQQTEVRYNERIRRGYMYAGTITGFHLPLPAMTERGHCGSPTVVLNSRYPRKIISIHAAGNDNTSFGLPIFREMFDLQLRPESLTPPQDDILLLSHQQLTPIEPIKIGNFIARYELQHNNSHPVQTDIWRSPLQDTTFGDNFQPSILANYDPRNKDNVDIQHVTIEKWAHEQPTGLDEECLDIVVEEWASFFANITKESRLKQFVLTKTEAINRCTYFPASQPLDRDTSAGYPWKHRPSAKGKHLFIRPRPHQDVILNCIPDDENGRDLHLAVDSMIRACRLGRRPAVVFAGSAKDEVLKNKKIYPCRTRGFAGAPLDYTLAHRMYFHTAICTLIQTRDRHPIKVGIEANGLEWHKLYSYLAENSTVGFDADFKDWDATIPRKVMERLPIIYNAIYSAGGKPSDTDDLVRTTLHSCLHGPLITYGQYVVQAPGGQVSGQPATTIDNCLAGLILYYYTWRKVAPDPSFASFQEHVRAAVYGDDHLCTVKPEALPYFNFESMQKIVTEHFGMNMTLAAKDGSSVKFKQVHELEFLKRDFKKIGPHYWGKLQSNVYDKMLNWTHTHKRHHFFKDTNRVHFELATLEASVQSMMFEMCIEDPDQYLAIARHCQEKLSALGSRFIVPSQRSMCDQRGIPHKLLLASYQ